MKSKEWNMLRMVAVLVAILISFSAVGVGAEGPSKQHYKMISTVEYTGDGQFRNQVETLLTVEKELLTRNQVRYRILTGEQGEFFQGLSFVVDRGSQRLSAAGEGAAFWEKVNNQCVGSLKKTTMANVGKTWKQSLDLSSLGDWLPGEMNFTLTAMQLEKEAYGEMIAVRALSEPFFVRTPKGTFRSRINTAYLFDSKIEDVYLSISVFEASTDMNGIGETLRHEVATYKTDTKANPIDLSGLGKDFGRLVERLGLAKAPLRVVKKTSLPDWAKSEGLSAAQVANISSSLACEGALNPVSTVSIPAARVVEFQKAADSELVTSNAQLGAGWNVWQSLVDKFGVWGAGGIVAGATLGGIAAGGGFSGGGGGSSSTPVATSP